MFVKKFDIIEEHILGHGWLFGIFCECFAGNRKSLHYSNSFHKKRGTEKVERTPSKIFLKHKMTIRCVQRIFGGSIGSQFAWRTT